MTKARDELREKVNDLMCEAISAARYNNPGWLDVQINNEEQILSQVDTYVKNEVIGQDDPINKNFEWTSSQERKKGKNILRAEQRKRAGLE